MTHIQQRRDEAAIWTSENPTLFDGEAGHESDTGREKIGDGATAWNALPYKFGVDSVAGKTGEVELDIADVTGAAPQVSPAFTGTPTAPTPPTADDDTSIATTAYVKANLATKADLSTPWMELYSGPDSYNYTAEDPQEIIPGGGPYDILVPDGRTLEVEVQLPRLELNGLGGMQVWVTAGIGQVRGGWWENPSGDGFTVSGQLTHSVTGTGDEVTIEVRAFKLGTNGGYIRGILGQQGIRIKYRIT